MAEQTRAQFLASLKPGDAVAVFEGWAAHERYVFTGRLVRRTPSGLLIVESSSGGTRCTFRADGWHRVPRGSTYASRHLGAVEGKGSS